MKQMVITGGNAGIGFETARALVSGGHRVIIVVRDADKGQDAMHRIRAEHPEGNISMVRANLTDFDSIHQAADHILEDTPVIDVLIHNAGTFQGHQIKNGEGIELTFMVNHLAPFYLSHLLLPGLASSEESRLINVNSDSHFLASFDPGNLNLDHRYQGLRAYSRSKLANIYFTYEFERRNPFAQLSTYVLHPGLVNTDIGAKNGKYFERLIWNWRSRSGKTPAEGADTSIYLATEDRDKLTSGLYWDHRRPRKSSKLSYHLENARILWEKSMTLCGLENYFGLGA